MYNQSYEDYMKSVLGYIPDNNTYLENANYNYSSNMYQYGRNYEDDNLENMYPDIYRKIYPMIYKVCSNNSKPITEELISNLTDEIYFSIEGNEEANVKQNQNLKNGDVINPRAKQVTSENYKKVEETRQSNFLLRDLIRILLIRELLGRRRPGPGMPPPNRPPFPGGRPPIMPRDYYGY